jgi:hypothetical protein
MVTCWLGVPVETRLLQKHLQRAKHVLKEGDLPDSLIRLAKEITAMGNTNEVIACVLSSCFCCFWQFNNNGNLNMVIIMAITINMLTTVN